MFNVEKDLFHLYIRGDRNKVVRFSEVLILFKTFFKALFWDIIRAIRVNRNKNYIKPELNNKVLIHADSINNLKALSFLRSRYPDAILTCVGGYVGERNDSINLRNGYSTHPNFVKYLFIINLIFLPEYGVRMMRIIILNYFYLNFYHFIFKNNKPKIIFISNDHTASSRGIMLVSKQLGIKVVYLQHGCVAEVLPPLRVSYCFLYGCYSKDVYRRIGNLQGKIFTIGNPIFDEYMKDILEKKLTYKIGIAYNTLDNVDDVIRMVDELFSKIQGYQIYIRPHPADKRQLSFSDNYIFSDSKIFPTVEFLKEMDIVIAGNTSLLLEAACMNVLPLQYDFSNYDPYLKDYYGFIRYGLAIHCVSIEEMIDKINDFVREKDKDIRKRAMAYDASIGSEYEFQVKEKIFSILDKYAL